MNKKNLRNILIAVILLSILMIYPFLPRIRQSVASSGETALTPLCVSDVSF